MIRKIIHVDMDAFFAAVEQRDHPELRGKPVAVGGSPDRRGAVAAASYEARKFGVRSAMPSRTAQHRCPELIFVKPRFEVYRAVSEQIRSIFHDYTERVEPLALDEAYLDVTGHADHGGSATLLAREIKQRIYQTTALTASAGISVNKFLAKLASGLNKPNGLTLISPEEAEDFVAALAIEKFYGVGEATAAKMHHLGIQTGADLRRWSEVDLVQQFGKVGQFYFKIVRGIDDRPVNPNRIRKSVGAERSFDPDLTQVKDMQQAIAAIAETVAQRLTAHHLRGRTITLKIRYSNYELLTRSRTLTEAVRDAGILTQVAINLLEGTEARARSVRLLGITVSSLDRSKVLYEQLRLAL